MFLNETSHSTSQSIKANKILSLVGLPSPGKAYWRLVLGDGLGREITYVVKYKCLNQQHMSVLRVKTRTLNGGGGGVNIHVYKFCL